MKLLYTPSYLNEGKVLLLVDSDATSSTDVRDTLRENNSIKTASYKVMSENTLDKNQ